MPECQNARTFRQAVRQYFSISVFHFSSQFGSSKSLIDCREQRVDSIVTQMEQLKYCVNSKMHSARFARHLLACQRFKENQSKICQNKYAYRWSKIVKTWGSRREKIFNKSIIQLKMDG